MPSVVDHMAGAAGNDRRRRQLLASRRRSRPEAGEVMVGVEGCGLMVTGTSVAET